MLSCACHLLAIFVKELRHLADYVRLAAHLVFYTMLGWYVLRCGMLCIPVSPMSPLLSNRGYALSPVSLSCCSMAAQVNYEVGYQRGALLETSLTGHATSAMNPVHAVAVEVSRAMHAALYPYKHMIYVMGSANVCCAIAVAC